MFVETLSLRGSLARRKRKEGGDEETVGDEMEGSDRVGYLIPYPWAVCNNYKTNMQEMQWNSQWNTQRGVEF
jgi:hypothetical protein